MKFNLPKSENMLESQIISSALSWEMKLAAQSFLTPSTDIFWNFLIPWWIRRQKKKEMSKTLVFHEFPLWCNGIVVSLLCQDVGSIPNLQSGLVVMLWAWWQVPFVIFDALVWDNLFRVELNCHHSLHLFWVLSITEWNLALLILVKHTFFYIVFHQNGFIEGPLGYIVTVVILWI